MRTKEVENAIKVIQRDIKDWKEMLEIEIEFEDGTDEQQVAYLTQQTTSYETLLSYIEELEKLPNKIRDNIKELEEDIEESKRMIKNATEEDEKKWWQEELMQCATGKVYLKLIIGE